MNNKEELINKLEDFTEVIKNCNSDCDNCKIYETCIEKYSDENLINLLNETIKFWKIKYANDYLMISKHSKKLKLHKETED